MQKWQSVVADVLVARVQPQNIIVGLSEKHFDGIDALCVSL